MSLLWSQESHGAPIRPRYQDVSSSNREMLNVPPVVHTAIGRVAHDVKLPGVYDHVRGMQVWHTGA